MRITDLAARLIATNYAQHEGPDSYGYQAIWFDAINSAAGGNTLRVVTHPDDGDRFEIHGLDRHMALLWTVEIDGATPELIAVASVKAAEKWLNGKTAPRRHEMTPAEFNARDRARQHA